MGPVAESSLATNSNGTSDSSLDSSTTDGSESSHWHKWHRHHFINQQYLFRVRQQRQPSTITTNVLFNMEYRCSLPCCKQQITPWLPGNSTDSKQDMPLLGLSSRSRRQHLSGEWQFWLKQPNSLRTRAIAAPTRNFQGLKWSHTVCYQEDERLTKMRKCWGGTTSQEEESSQNLIEGPKRKGGGKEDSEYTQTVT